MSWSLTDLRLLWEIQLSSIWNISYCEHEKSTIVDKYTYITLHYQNRKFQELGNYLLGMKSCL